MFVGSGWTPWSCDALHVGGEEDDEEDDEEDTSVFACVHRATDSQLPTHEVTLPQKRHETKTTAHFFISSFETRGALEQ